MAVNMVRAISVVRMSGLASTALKYPCSRMLENTRICRNIAPPKQLRPKLWPSRLIRWLNWASMVIVCTKEHCQCINT
jgi:hypothetical protein